jgi:hypothetical protein
MMTTEAKDLQSIAKPVNPNEPPHPDAVRHGSGGQYIHLGGGWLIPLTSEKPKAEDAK